MSEKKKFPWKRIFLILFLLVLAGGGIAGWWFYGAYYKSNVDLHGKAEEFYYIRTGTNFQQLTDDLESKHIIISRKGFEEIAGLKKFKTPKPGRYRLKNGMSNQTLINLFRSGEQEPVKISFNNVRTKEQLVSRIGKQLEADSLKLLELLNDENYVKEKYGMNTTTVMTMFLPNTYEFYWNTSAEQFLERMRTEYKNFWNTDRRQKAKEIGLTQSEVSILASIVQSEQQVFNDEKKTIAGLYLNRIHKGMMLQSDPTVIFAIGDFSIHRVLESDLLINSPYNTYLHTGLPPGPICMPDISSLDAVLNYQHHNYIFMCAEYGTGRHKFASDLATHNRNADEFHRALNKANIKH